MDFYVSIYYIPNKFPKEWNKLLYSAYYLHKKYFLYFHPLTQK